MSGFIKNLLAPPKCAGCGERLSIFDDSAEKAFCDNCRGAWEHAKRSVCKGCGLENVECICKIKGVKNARVLSLIKFGHSRECDRLIYTLKKRRNQRLFDFAADELYRRLSTEEKLTGIKLEDAIFTNVPRNTRSKNRYGFDHAQLLAASLSERTGGEYDKLILRKKGGRAQKKLGVEARKKNVKNRFVFNKKKNIEGKKVILVDDVLTTGATASECMSALRENGASEVILLVIARAGRKTRKTIKKKGENDGAV